MFRIGSTMRSAKTNDATPPKLIPPFHSTAASGTFPIEHTNENMATTGPTRGPHSFATSGWCTKKKLRQNESGTHAASAPAISSPPNTSIHTEAQSMTKKWLIAVNPRDDATLPQTEP